MLAHFAAPTGCGKPLSNPVKIPLEKTKRRALLVFLLFQRYRDSNPNKQSQSLSCYRYTIPLQRVIFYHKFLPLSILFFKKIKDF